MQLNRKFENIDDIEEYFNNFSLENFKELGFQEDPKSISNCEDLIYIRNENERGKDFHLRINPETERGALNRFIDGDRCGNIFTFDLNNPQQLLFLLEHKLCINLNTKDAVDRYKLEINYDTTEKDGGLDIGC